MKKLISFLSIIFIAGFTFASTNGCSNTSEGDNVLSENESDITIVKDKVKVYYFHATRRCATCQAVEEVTASAVKEYYGSKVSFQSINRDEEKDNPLIKKHQISGQTLLIICGDKVVNLTNDAFMNARTNPDKLKAKLKETIDSMM